MTRLHFTGCGRTGTRFVYSVLCSQLHLDVMFEAPSKSQHLVSWMDGLRTDLPYDYKIVQIRNPFKVLSSLVLSNEEAWKWADNSLRRDAKMEGLRQPYENHREWNAVALFAQWYLALQEDCDFIFRIEDVSTVLPSLLEHHLGIHYVQTAQAIRQVLTTCNTVKREQMFWSADTIERVCPTWAPIVFKLADRFHYGEPI